jgi:hypothetical protein
MAEPASRPLSSGEETPSFDPAAIERAYRRERTRRYVRHSRQESLRGSNARFYVTVAFLLFLTVVLALGALREVQHTFGI